MIAGLRTLLSPDEAARAERLRVPAKVHEFIAARGYLRRILARYLHTPPSSLNFAYGSAGKPFLDSPRLPLFFNLAHAGTWGLLGIAGDQEVGIDVEWLQRPVDIRQIASWAFAGELCSELESLPPEIKRARFHLLWTDREARLKTLGIGFSHPVPAGFDDLASGHFLLEPDYLGAWATAVSPRLISYWDETLRDSK